MSSPRKPHKNTLPHIHADRLINHLISVKGQDTRSNREIAEELGISLKQLGKARNHTLAKDPCDSLGGFKVSLRNNRQGARGALVLTDPDLTRSESELLDIEQRVAPSLATVESMQSAWMTARGHLAIILKAEASEFLRHADSPKYEAMNLAAKNVREEGRIRPETLALLRSLGIALTPAPVPKKNLQQPQP